MLMTALRRVAIPAVRGAVVGGLASGAIDAGWQEAQINVFHTQRSFDWGQVLHASGGGAEGGATAGVLYGVLHEGGGRAGVEEPAPFPLPREPATPEALAERSRAIREAAPGGPIGSSRNVAVASYIVDGQAGEVSSVSGNAARPGMVAAPTDPRFNPTAPGGFDRPLDAEYKILSDIATRLTPNSTGRVVLYSEMPPCPACRSVITQFREAFPRVQLIVASGG
jgi:hypothetical protein